MPPGDIACPVSCAFYNDWGALDSFFKLPGNAHYGKRVVQIQNVHRNGEPRRVWAVPVGAARFVQDCAKEHASPNCALHFEPGKGFNAGSFNLVANVAIEPNAPLLLNFGVDVDCVAAKELAARDDASFRGALDLLSESRKSTAKKPKRKRLPRNQWPKRLQQ